MSYIPKARPQFFFQIRAHIRNKTNVHNTQMHGNTPLLYTFHSNEVQTTIGTCHQLHSYQTTKNEQQVTVMDPPQSPKTKLPQWPIHKITTHAQNNATATESNGQAPTITTFTPTSRDFRLQVLRWLSGAKAILTRMETTLPNVPDRNFSLLVAEELAQSSMLSNVIIMEPGPTVWPYFIKQHQRTP